MTATRRRLSLEVERLEDRLMPANHAPSGTDFAVTMIQEGVRVFHASDFGYADPMDSSANNFHAIKVVDLPTAGTLKKDGQVVDAGDFISVTDLDADKFTLCYGSSAEMVLIQDQWTFRVQDDGGSDDGGVDLDETLRSVLVYVYPPPAALYGAYQASIAQSDLAFTNAVNAARGAYFTAIESVSNNLQSGGVDAQRAYETAITQPYQIYEEALAASNAALQTALLDGEHAWWVRVQAAYSAYDTATAAIESNWQNAVASAQSAYENAVAQASQAFDDFLLPFQQALASAHQAAIADPEDADAQAALAAADEALADAQIQATATRDQALADALGVREGSLAAAQNESDSQLAAAQSALGAENAAADSDWATAETAANETASQAEGAAQAVFADTVSGSWTSLQSSLQALQWTYDTTLVTAGAQLKNAVSAARMTWQTSEQGAWDNYVELLANLPGAPTPDSRRFDPPGSAEQGQASTDNSSGQVGDSGAGFQAAPAFAASFTIAWPGEGEAAAPKNDPPPPDRPPAPLENWGYVNPDVGRYLLENGRWYLELVNPIQVGSESVGRIPLTSETIPNFEQWATPVRTPDGLGTERTFLMGHAGSHARWFGNRAHFPCRGT